MHSLSQRLLLSLGLSLVLVFAVMEILSSQQVDRLTEHMVLSRLEHDSEELLAAMDVDSTGRIVMIEGRIPSMFLRPFSGHYFVIRDGGQTIRSRSLWDEVLAPEKPGVPRAMICGFTSSASERIRVTARMRPVSLEAIAKLTVAFTLSGTTPAAIAESTPTSMVCGVRLSFANLFRRGMTKARPPLKERNPFLVPLPETIPSSLPPTSRCARLRTARSGIGGLPAWLGILAVAGRAVA